MNPGVYDISSEKYQKAKGVNQSLLKKMDESPYHAKCYLENPKKQTESMAFGNIFHSLSLEGKETPYVIKPEGMKFTTKEGKEWQEKQNSKLILESKAADALLGMLTSIREHPMAYKILSCGKPEQSLFAKDPETGLLLKCRIDLLREGNSIVDVKTTKNAHPRVYKKQISDLKYYMQAAFYLDMANLLGMDKKCFIHVAIEKTPPYALACYNLDILSINLGRKEYRKYLRSWAKCVEENRYPGYSDEIMTISLPPWDILRLEEEFAHETV